MNQLKINNGIPWYDQNGEPVNAHGGCLLKERDTYYLFGEYKTNDVNKFTGFSCYSSKNLEDWTFERISLPVQKEGILGPNRIGERVKVVKCPTTGKFIMFMHTDDLFYNEPAIGMAISDDISGEFQFIGTLKYQGKAIKMWDMGTFVDRDGTAYLLIHEGDIYKLSADYMEAVEKVTENIAPGGESPAMFRTDETYFLMFSNKTSWERNDNYYFSAPSIYGPWTKQGLFCPEGSLTYNSQCSFVFEFEKNGKYFPMYMGDRWSFPKQKSSATQIWLPIETKGQKCWISEYCEQWSPENLEPIIIHATKKLNFISNRKDEKLDIAFSGRQILVFGETSSGGGYADFGIYTKSLQKIHSGTIDFYSLVTHSGLRYISPKLDEGEYILRITVTKTNGIWFKKNGESFGSKDYFVKVFGYSSL